MSLPRSAKVVVIGAGAMGSATAWWLARRGRSVALVEQFEQALGNLLTALRAAGGEPHHLASMTVYIVDMDDYRAHAHEIGTVWRRLVGREYPAMAAIGVARLWDVAALVELQGVAELP